MKIHDNGAVEFTSIELDTITNALGLMKHGTASAISKKIISETERGIEAIVKNIPATRGRATMIPGIVFSLQEVTVDE